LAAEFRDQGEPTDPRHDRIGNHKVGTPLVAGGKTLPAVTGFAHLVPTALEDGSDQPPHVGVVIDDQNLRHVRPVLVQPTFGQVPLTLV
jgi:hypothetical protein